MRVNSTTPLTTLFADLKHSNLQTFNPPKTKALYCSSAAHNQNQLQLIAATPTKTIDTTELSPFILFKAGA